MAEKIYDHLTIDGDDAKLDGAVIANLENNEEFADLKEDIGHLTASVSWVEDVSVSASDWEAGNLSSAAGLPVGSPYIIRTGFIPISENVNMVFTGVTKGQGESANRVRYNYCYDKNMNYLGRTWDESLLSGTEFARFVYGFTTTSGQTVSGYGFNNLVADWNATFENIINKENVEKAIEAVSISDHYDYMGAMMDAAETYFNVAYSPTDRIIYHAGHGLFYEDVEWDNEKAMVCSMFVEACLYGIKYESSRYVQDTNERSHWGYVTDGTGHYASLYEEGYMDDYMTSAFLAKYCQEHGWLHEFNGNRPNEIKPGDILFYSSEDSTNWNGIVHCTICVRAYKDYYMTVESSSTHTRPLDNQAVGLGMTIYRYDNTTRPLTYFARMPLESAIYHSILIDSESGAYSGSYSTDSARVLYKTFSEPLEQGFYTVVFDDNGTSGGGYVKAFYGEYGNRNFNAQKIGKENSIVLYAEAPITAMDFRVSKYASQESATYDVSEIKVYRGYRPLEA